MIDETVIATVTADAARDPPTIPPAGAMRVAR
jgi:hypothetical protein